MNLLRNKPLLFAICALAVAAGAGVAHLQKPVPLAVQNATVLDFPRPLPALDLIDHTGQGFTNERLNNTWSVVFFGFTHCPDVCPTTMSMLSSTTQLLKEHSATTVPEVIMISVDPKRDTPEALGQYVPFFNEAFTGVTGTEAQIKSLTETMGVAYREVPKEDGDYTIDHTSALFIINPEGALQAISSSPHVPETLANDLLAIASRQP